MKKLLVFVAALVIASSSFGTLLSEGTQELALSGSLDFETGAGTDFDIAVFYGRFFADNVEAGPLVGLEYNDIVTNFRIGGRGEYNFDLGTEWVPFVAGEILYINNDTDNSSISAAELGMDLGVKFFMTEYLAISTALALGIATDDIYPVKDDVPQNYDVAIELGLRTFF